MSIVGGKFTLEKRNLVTHVDPALYEKFREKASAHQRSVSAEAAWLINNYVVEEVTQASDRSRPSAHPTVVATNSLTVQNILQHLNQLPDEVQPKVLEFTKTLIHGQPKGTSGQVLLGFCGAIKPDELALMQEVVETADDLGDEW